MPAETGAQVIVGAREWVTPPGHMHPGSTHDSLGAQLPRCTRMSNDKPPEEARPQETGPHGEEAIIQGFLAPLARGYSGRLRPHGRLRAADAGTRHRARAQDRSGGRGRAFPSRRCAAGHRLEGAGRQCFGPRRQGRGAPRLPDGAVVSRGADGGLDDGLCRRPGGGPDPVRLPSDGRRHGSPAGAADNFHHGHRLGTAGQDGAANDGASGRRAVRLRHHRGCRARPGTGQGCRPCKQPGGLSDAAGEHPAPALSAPRAETGAGARCCATTPRRPWMYRTASSRTSTGCCGLRASQGVLSPPRCPCPTRPARSLRRLPSACRG